MADAPDSGSGAVTGMWVQVPSLALIALLFVIFLGVAQMVAHYLGVVGAAGSSPVTQI